MIAVIELLAESHWGVAGGNQMLLLNHVWADAGVRRTVEKRLTREPGVDVPRKDPQVPKDALARWKLTEEEVPSPSAGMDKIHLEHKTLGLLLITPTDSRSDRVKSLL